jgi:hypothetical protein
MYEGRRKATPFAKTPLLTLRTQAKVQFQCHIDTPSRDAIADDVYTFRTLSFGLETPRRPGSASVDRLEAGPHPHCHGPGVRC